VTSNGTMSDQIAGQQLINFSCCLAIFFCCSGKKLSKQSKEDMKMNKVIKIGSELVKVSEEIYKEYYKMARRERYMENDIKIGRIDVNEESGVTTFIPSKEDSIDRLMEHGTDFTDDKTIEDIICDKVMLIILQEAMVELNPKEQDFIKNVYYKKLTVREIAKNENVSHVAIVKRNKKVLNKLRKLLNKSGYQTTPLIG